MIVAKSMLNAPSKFVISSIAFCCAEKSLIDCPNAGYKTIEQRARKLLKKALQSMTIKQIQTISHNYKSNKTAMIDRLINKNFVHIRRYVNKISFLRKSGSFDIVKKIRNNDLF